MFLHVGTMLVSMMCVDWRFNWLFNATNKPDGGFILAHIWLTAWPAD